MHEEISEKSINLAIRTTKVTVQTLLHGLKSYLRHRVNKHVKKQANKNAPTKGKQSVKQLIKQGQGVSTAEISDEGIKDFKKLANKYGLDFAIVKEKGTQPPVYTVFFKARDADAITRVLQEYSKKQLKSKEATKRPSVIDKLKKFKAIVAKTPRKEKERKKEHQL